MGELHVPEQALTELERCTRDYHDPECVERIAAPVVIAELRRIAGELHAVENKLTADPEIASGYGGAADLLLARADELDRKDGEEN